MIHSFLLIGQSNMAGRGDRAEVPPCQNPHVFKLVNGRWQPPFHPLNHDRPFSGTNLAESFADAYANAHGVDVGLIPCADGGTSLSQWMPGEILYDHAVFQAKLAMRSSTLSGILWHQGEGDCSAALYPLYADKLRKMVRAMRAELGIAELPFLCGGLGDFLADCTLDTALVNYPYVNDALRTVCQSEVRMVYVPAEGLCANDDNLHFSALGLYKFGLRYFAALESLSPKSTPAGTQSCGDTDVMKERSWMEAL